MGVKFTDTGENMGKGIWGRRAEKEIGHTRQRKQDIFKAMHYNLNTGLYVYC